METNKARKVEVTKQFPVSPQKLYQAWTGPEQLKQWWKPMGNKLVEVINDLKEGGTVSYTCNDDSLTISGKYEEVRENEKLVYSWNWQFKEDVVKNAAYKLTVQFEGKESGSAIYIIQERVLNEVTTSANEEGWDKGLSDLEAFLASSIDNGSNHQSKGDEKASVEPGYQEMPEQQKVGGG